MTRTRITVTIAAGIACVAMLFGTGGTAAATSSVDEPVPGKLLLMLDASGSMKAKDPSGLTKIDAAKKALTGVVGALPDTAQVGLRVYGAKVDGKGKPTAAACADTQLVTPIGKIDKPALTTAISAIQALGETPIAHSLTEALKDLGTAGKRNIVLVSDGEESCVPDPCPVIKKLTAAGVDLQIDTVGFGVNTKARTQLQCIADAGKGTYYDAKDASALTASLTKLSTRATRPFAFTGRPITGVDVQGDDAQAPAGAPTLSPGLFTDQLTASKDTWRSYRIQRTLPESTLHVTFATKPRSWQSADLGDNQLEQLFLRVLADDGTECTNTFTITGDGLGLRPVVTVAARVIGQAIDPTPRFARCRDDNALTVLARRDGGLAATPTEITVIEEPRVTNVSSLPPAVDRYPAEVVLPAGPSKPVTGGLAFSDAAVISTGTWGDKLVPGETLMYRVKVEDGQTVRFTANGPASTALPPGSNGNLWVDGRAYAPDRQAVGLSIRKAGFFSGAGITAPKSTGTAPITYRNRFITPPSQDNIQSSSLSGWYYYAVGVGTSDLGTELAGVPIDITFTVKVEGEPSGAVTYDGAGPNDPLAQSSTSASAGAAQPSATSGARAEKGTGGEGTSPFVWLGLGAIVVLGAGGAAYTIARTRQRAHRDG